MNTLCRKLKNGVKYIANAAFRFKYNAAKGMYKNMSDEEYLKKMFKYRTGRELNLDAPLTFNEKMQWLKLYDHRSDYTKMVDKYEAKLYVADVLGSEYIIPTLGVWRSFDEIEFDNLPEKFVLKCTHDSGGNVICRNKNAFNKKFAKKKIERSLKRNYYYLSREWPYKNVEPRIIAEQYMEDEGSNKNEMVKGLIDYKFFCFHGVPKFLYVSKGLEDHKTAKISFYSLEGKELEFHRKDFAPLGEIELPNNFDEMKICAEKLAKEINSPFVRIDLYSIQNKVYFSEITFTPCAGMIPFEPEEYDLKIGKMLDISRGV